jgi:hypothetical protein
MGLFKLSWPILHGDQREGLSYRPACLPLPLVMYDAPVHIAVLWYLKSHTLFAMKTDLYCTCLHCITSNPVFMRLRTSLYGEQHIISWQFETAVIQLKVNEPNTLDE